MSPLWPLLMMFLVTILTSSLLFWSIKTLLHQNQNLESRYNQQVQDLLNRLMTKEWQSYQALTSSRLSPIQTLDGEGVGLSDDNELKKLAEILGENYPVGDILVETGLDEYDRHELGLDLP